MAGAALSFSFAPWEWWPLAPLSLFVLYALLQPLAPGRAAFAGFAFGLGYFGLGVNWVYHSLHIFGGAAEAFAVLLTGLLIMVEALFITGATWVWARLRSAGMAPIGYRSAALDAWLFAAVWSMSSSRATSSWAAFHGSSSGTRRHPGRSARWRRRWACTASASC